MQNRKFQEVVKKVFELSVGAPTLSLFYFRGNVKMKKEDIAAELYDRLTDQADLEEISQEEFIDTFMKVLYDYALVPVSQIIEN